MKQYVTYFRVSTAEQGRSGLGLEAQHRDVNLFLEGFSEVPWEVIGTYTDVESGKHDDRPALTEALDLVRRTGATLLVAKVDRLSRDLAFVATLLKDPKVNLRVATMPHAQKMEIQLWAMLAEQERDFISARTKAALAQAKTRGVKLGGLRPKTEARNAAVQAQAKANADRVSGIVQPLRAQGASLRAIADALNGSGVPTARGGIWTAKQVQRTLERLGQDA